MGFGRVRLATESIVFVVSAVQTRSAATVVAGPIVFRLLPGSVSFYSMMCRESIVGF